VDERHEREGDDRRGHQPQGVLDRHTRVYETANLYVSLSIDDRSSPGRSRAVVGSVVIERVGFRVTVTARRRRRVIGGDPLGLLVAVRKADGGRHPLVRLLASASAGRRGRCSTATGRAWDDPDAFRPERWGADGGATRARVTAME
jgi:hypothetical protein